jgi:PAS domain S-box-containing protein
MRKSGENSEESAELDELRKRVAGFEAIGLGLARPASMIETESVFLSSLMSNIPDNIYFKDRESRFLMINRALADRFGLKSPSEAIGKTDADFFLPEHALDARQDEIDIMRTGIPIVGKEEHEVMKDGDGHWVSTTKLPLRNRSGDIIGTFGVSHDITGRKLAEMDLLDSEEELRRHRNTLEDRVRERTLELEQINRQLQREVQERRRAESALRQNEDRYRQLLSTSPTYVYTVWVRNGEAVATEHGSGCVAITGYTPEEYAANNLLWIHMIHPEDKDMVLGQLAVDVAGEKRKPLEHRIVHKDGSIRWVRNTIVHHRDDRGQLTHYDGLVEDITERKLTEEAVRDGERLKAMSSLATGAAHSFNTVLSIINGNATSISENVLPGTAAHREARLIVAAVEHASDLTRRLLGMADAFEAHKPEVVETIWLHGVVKETLELVEHPFAERDVRLELRLSDEQPAVRGVSTHVLDMLMSLLTNAVEAMPNGGVIRVRTRMRQIRRPSRWNHRAKPGRYAVLYVSDTGSGIAKEDRDRVFEPFFTSKNGATSFGLGLTITRSMIESMGGWIDVRSRVGAGTIFRLFFQATDAPPRKAEPAEEFSVAGSGVLVVDDDQATVDLMTGGLQAAGFVVHPARSASEGLALYRVKRDEIAVSVLDLVMPLEDGRQIVETILKEDPTARIVVTSGFSRDFVRNYLPFGAWNYLQKPFDDAMLVEAVKNCLRRPSR